MKLTKRTLLRASALLIAFSIVAHAAPEKDTSKPEPEATAVITSETKQRLTAKRDGDKVTLSWTLPEGKWSRVEVVRNNKESIKGRFRIKSLKSTVTTHTDRLPAAGKPYWYWIKLTSKDKKVTNLGPVKVE